MRCLTGTVLCYSVVQRRFGVCWYYLFESFCEDLSGAVTVGPKVHNAIEDLWEFLQRILHCEYAIGMGGVFERVPLSKKTEIPACRCLGHP